MMRTAFSVSMALLTLQALVAPAAPGQADRADQNAVTFSKDVAPIFYKQCTSCHRQGDMAPMSLLTYKEARPWARSIQKRVINRDMPPWHADQRFAGAFSNERHLTDREIATIDEWVSRGALEGDPRDLPAPPEYTDGWRIGKPDVILRMQEPFDVPAQGVVDYQYFTIPTNFTEDKWIAAAEVRPGNRGVVHHVILFVQPPGPPTQPPGIKMGLGVPAVPPPKPANARPPVPRTGSARAPQPLGSLLVGEAPGALPIVFTPEAAKLIAAGSRLTFQMHYTPNGTAATDVTEVGLVFARQPAEHQIRSIAVMNNRLAIPPGDPDYEVTSEVTFNEDARIWSVFPHMHVRGKNFEYKMIYPDGRSEVILNVPKYDFNWQGDYVFKQPIAAPKGSRLECTAHFDNSARNKANPDPGREVRWGDQTWDEMMIGWTAYSLDAERTSLRTSSPTTGGKP